MKHYDPKSMKIVICPECKGQGWNEYERCTVCEGLGRLVREVKQTPLYEFDFRLTSENPRED